MEHWKIDDFNYPSDLDSCEPCEGLRIVDEEDLEFLCECANALHGIQTEQLGEVKKAWMAWKLVEWTKEMDIYEPFQNMQEPIDIALDFRKHGHDFGELNDLIDSFA